MQLWHHNQKKTVVYSPSLHKASPRLFASARLSSSAKRRSSSISSSGSALIAIVLAPLPPRLCCCCCAAHTAGETLDDPAHTLRTAADADDTGLAPADPPDAGFRGTLHADERTDRGLPPGAGDTAPGGVLEPRRLSACDAACTAALAVGTGLVPALGAIGGK